MSCVFCGEKSQYRDRHTGQRVCLEHARLEVVAAESIPTIRPLTIRPAVVADLAHIETLSLYFWDETKVECFDRVYDVLHCPAFLACEGDEVAGLAAYAVEVAWNTLALVMLNVLPDYQGQGTGRALLDAVRNDASQRSLARVIVATSNDDLPALGLYQRYGFRITGIKPGRIARHHGGELSGFAGIPVRDEIQLEYRLTM